jgi:MFS family permease
MAMKLQVSSTTARSSRSLWRNFDYLLLFSGQAISGFGSESSQLAFPLLVLALTQSPLQAGIISGLRLVPYIVLGLPAGAWVDRVDRKHLMTVCEIIRMLTLGSVPFAYSIGHLTLLHLYVAVLIEGSLNVLFKIAELSCIPHVVEKEQVGVAMGLDQAADGVARALGPSFGGLLFSVSQLLPFATDAISYIISAISLLLIRVSFQNKKQPVVQRKLLADMAEGLNWLWNQPFLRIVLCLNFGWLLGQTGIPLLLITLMQQQHASSASTGLAVASGGVGALVGSLVAPLIQKRFSYKHIVIISGWAYLLFWSLYLLTSVPLLLGAITAANSILTPIQVVAFSAYQVQLIPDELLGRVNGVQSLLIFSAFAIGSLAVGTLLQLAGPTITILLFSAIYLILAVLASSNVHIRRALSWAEIQKIHGIANAAHAFQSQLQIEDISRKNTWVSFDRYLVKLPLQETNVQEVYAFPSRSDLASYRGKGQWTGIEHYRLRLPDRYKDAQNGEGFFSAARATSLPHEECWTGIEHYLLKLPDRYKDALKVDPIPTLPGVLVFQW